MLDTVYIGMTGLTSFSKGLTNISNNVANLNTPGYKGSQLEFQDLFYRYQYSNTPGGQGGTRDDGSGVKTGSSFRNFSAGQYSQTGNDLDAMVDGNGLFVVQRAGKTFYTRAGQFKLDDAGYLVTSDGVSRVEALVGNSLGDISVAGRRSNPAKATQTIKFANVLSTSDTTFAVQNVTVYDTLGVKHLLTLNLTNNSSATPGQWSIALMDGSTSVASGTISYSATGSAVTGSDTVRFSYDPGNGATPTDITLDFSGSNYFSSSSSSLSVSSQDGYTAGVLTKTALDTDGSVVLTYSNGQTDRGPRLALAWFNNMAVLKPEGNNQFSTLGEAERIMGSPGDMGMGALKVQGVELSNVDLAKEFSELIVIQRGYQASSQVVTAANEMIQQLGDIRGRR